MSDNEYPKTYKGPYYSLVVPDKDSEPTPEQLADFLDEEKQRQRLEQATSKVVSEMSVEDIQQSFISWLRDQDNQEAVWLFCSVNNLVDEVIHSDIEDDLKTAFLTAIQQNPRWAEIWSSRGELLCTWIDF